VGKNNLDEKMDSLIAPPVNRGRRSQLNCKPPVREKNDDEPEVDTRTMSMSEKLASHRNSQFKNGHKSQMYGQSRINATQNATQSLVGTSQFERPSVNLGGCKVNSRSVRKYGSVKAILLENERMSRAGITIIHPYSTFRLVWDTMTLVLLLVNMLCIPVFMAFPVFEFDNPYATQENAVQYQWVAFIVKIISDSFFAIDMVLSFRTGLLQEGADNEVVIDAAKIRKAYLKKWFWLDLVSTIPFDVFIGAIANMSMHEGMRKSTTFLRYFRLTKLFQLLRLLRLTRVFRSKHQWEEMMSIPYDDALVILRILTVILTLLCYAHISACMQFMIPMITGFEHDTWVMIRGLETAEFSVQYGWSFFRAVSQMLCIGYGLSPPNSMLDMYVVTVLMLLGAIGFALYIGYTTSILQSHNASKRLYTEKYSSIKQYMLFRKLPMELRRRISDYYENRYQGKMFNEKQILKELNPILREELINHNCRELVDAVPFFTEADPEFVSTVVTHLKFEVYLYGDEIIRQGTIGRKMYFISRGTVRIVNNRERDLSKSQTLSDGEFFGEISIVLPTKRRVASVFADSYCYLYSLAVEDFNEVLEEFPMQRKHFMAEAAKRLENMRDEDSESIGGHTSAMSIRKWYKKRTTIGRGKNSRARESKGYKRSLMGQR
jgi:CRP-like cAMP-binding protein